jgi:hypothetical protein
MLLGHSGTLDSRPEPGCQNPIVRVVMSGASGLTARPRRFGRTNTWRASFAVSRPGGRDCWNPAAGEVDAARLEGIDAIVNLSGANIGQPWTVRGAEILASRAATTACWPDSGDARSPPVRLLCASAISAYGVVATRSDRGVELDQLRRRRRARVGGGRRPAREATFASPLRQASSWRRRWCAHRMLLPFVASEAASGAASSGSAGSGWTTSSAHIGEH